MVRFAHGPRRATHSTKAALTAALVATVVALWAPVSAGADERSRPTAAATWLVPGVSRAVPLPKPQRPRATRRELAELAALDRRSPKARASVRRWEGQRGVTSWIDVLLGAVSADGVNPPRASRALALTSVAMNDALVIAARSRPRATGRPAPCRRRPWLSLGRCVSDGPLPPSAVAAGAAARVLGELLPARANELAQLEQEASRSRLFAGAAYASDVRAGLALGRAIGELAVGRARNDRSDTQGAVVPPPGDATWIPTPPAFAPALEPFAGTWRTWNLRAGDELRPPAPPPYLGRVHRAAIREVYDIAGGLTDRQREIALFWNDGPGSETPPGHWNRIALGIVEQARISPRRAAFVLAALNTTQADAFIACWSAKYTHWTKRPVTLIRELLDPTYLSVISTPPFPSYPSGHSTTSGAAATVLGALFPDRAGELADMADEAAISRLYGGIHYRFDNDAGLALGQRIGAVTLRSLGYRASRARPVK
jgi:membrane-associated phospholipid phosphatase